MLLAVLITLSHSVFAHHHHIKSAFHHELIGDDHDDDHDLDHNAFSFVQIDENYVASVYHHQWNSNTITLFIQGLPYLSILTQQSSKQIIVFCDDDPPPKPFITDSFSHRGPPTA